MSEKNFTDTTEVTTSGGETTVRNEPGTLKGYGIITNGTDDVTVEFYDGDQATGTKIWEAQLAGADIGREFAFPGHGKKFSNKINVVVTGTGGVAWVLSGN